MLIYRNFFLKLLFFAALLPASLSFAGNYESVDNLKNLAKDFVFKNIAVTSQEKLDVQVNQTDQMLSLAACSKPIDAGFPAEASSEQITAVELKCSGAESWRTLVPVNVAILTNVLVAKHTLSANSVISEDDLDYTLLDRNRLYNGFYQDKKDAIGLISNQVILSGVVLNKKNIQPPFLIHRNQVIDLVAKSNAVTVTMKGVAKTDGRLNEVIKAFNPSSKRTLDAVVIDANRAEVVS